MEHENIKKEFEALKAMASLDEDLEKHLNLCIDEGINFFNIYMKKFQYVGGIDPKLIQAVSDKIYLTIMFRCYKRMAYKEKKKVDDLRKIKPELRKIFKQLFN